MLVLLAILTASLAADRGHPAWMVGTWGWIDPGEKRSDCGTDHDITYYRNGTYDLLGETGTWRIEGNVLIETEGDPKHRTTTRSRFVRIASGVLRIEPPRRGTMVKCRLG